MRRSILSFLWAPLVAISAIAQTPSPVANVYVGSPTRGVYVYHAAADGQLTLVPGSPFQTVGQGVGSNGKYFFSLGTYLVHVYPVAANGSLKPQISQIDTRAYGGANCEPTWATDSLLDHTGQQLYVFLSNLPLANNCVTYQTYTINKSSGLLTFTGAATDPAWYAFAELPTLSGNDQYLYLENDFDINETLVNNLSALRREANGSLALWDIAITYPPEQGGLPWGPYLVANDPTNHLIVALYQYTGHNIFLGSFTEDAQGNLTTTNTYATMPITDVFPTRLDMSPDGAYLAVAGNVNNSAYHGTAGLEIYHVNGAAPLTKYAVLTTAPIDQIHWDKAGHLYAVSDSTRQVFVFTVTAASITPAPGSPYQVAAPSLDSLTVVPK